MSERYLDFRKLAAIVILAGVPTFVVGYNLGAQDQISSIQTANAEAGPTPIILLTPTRPFTESIELKTRIRETYHAHP